MAPPSRRNRNAGIRNGAGRRRARPRCLANCALLTGAGAVPLTAPVSAGVAMMCAIRRTRSSRSIHDIHCRPLPSGPPRPNSNGMSMRPSMPPSIPSTSPVRRRTTRTPNRCARFATRSQASQTRWVKQRLPPSNSVSVSSSHRPYQPMAEPLISTSGLCSSRAISRTTSRVMRSRDDRIFRRFLRVHPSADRLAGEIDHGIDPSIARDLVEAGHQPERRPQRRRLGRITRQHDAPMSGAGQRLDQPPPDEAGGTGHQYMLRDRQLARQLCCVFGLATPHAVQRDCAQA